jgi:hypothetical protein
LGVEVVVDFGGKVVDGKVEVEVGVGVGVESGVGAGVVPSVAMTAIVGLGE